jgi:hypothetical protein
LRHPPDATDSRRSTTSAANWREPRTNIVRIAPPGSRYQIEQAHEVVAEELGGDDRHEPNRTEQNAGEGDEVAGSVPFATDLCERSENVPIAPR